MAKLFDKTLIGFPLTVSFFISLLSTSANAIYIQIVALVAGLVIGGIIYGIFANVQEVTILGTGLTLSNFGKRYLGIVGFMGTYFLANMLSAIGALATAPMGIGLIIAIALGVMFTIGVYDWAVGWGTG